MVTGIRRLGHDRLLELKHGRGRHARRRHAHRCWSLNAVLRGATRTTVGRQEYLLHAGQFIWIPAEVPHLCTPRSENEFEYAVLYGDGSPEADTSFTADVVVIGDINVDGYLQTIHELDARRVRSAEETLSAVFRSIEWSSLTYARVPSRVPLEQSLPPTDRARLGESSGGSRYREYRNLRRRYGVTQHEYRQAVRIENAKVLLRSGASVVETAVECGFYDQSHLVKTFRLLTGLTPSQYQRAR